MEQLHSALSTLKFLRANVGQIFETLGSGIRIEHSDDGENKYLQEIQDLLASTNTNLRDLESTINSLTTPPAPLTLGNTSFLSQELSQERQALYSQLVNSHKWIDKVHEYGSIASNVFHGNSLKRSYNSNSNKTRRRNIVSCHNVPTIAFDNVLTNIERQLPGMSFKITRPHATNAIVYITLERVLKAVIIFKGIMIEWATIKGYDETFDDDLWTESKHQVFRKVQDHTHAAMLHFYSPTLPELAVKYFLAWLNSYSKLFNDPCKKCGNRLLNSSPPTWRDFRILEPFHEECK